MLCLEVMSTRFSNSSPFVIKKVAYGIISRYSEIPSTTSITWDILSKYLRPITTTEHKFGDRNGPVLQKSFFGKGPCHSPLSLLPTHKAFNEPFYPHTPTTPCPYVLNDHSINSSLLRDRWNLSPP